MMLSGTRLLLGDEANEYSEWIGRFRNWALSQGDMKELIVPVIWEQSTFANKVGPENTKMMWNFKDKGDRDVCLIPEVTGIVQEMWRNKWSKEMGNLKLFYISRCYRYERPQAGRYREFTQFGIELLGSKADPLEAIQFLKWFLDDIQLKGFEFNTSVKRGLSYYTDKGFEVSVPALGAQKQIAGGGQYAEGVGWAIGVERLIMASKLEYDK